MPINSQDQLIAALTAGQTLVTSVNKNVSSISAQSVGFWYDMRIGAGSPGVDALIGSGTNLTFQPVTENTTTTAVTAATSGSISGTTFTDTTHASGRFTVGQLLSGTGVLAGTYIIALGSGTGSNNGGTYTVNLTQTVTSQTITGTAVASFPAHGGDVSPSVKQLLSASMWSAAATTAPAIFQLVDIIGFVPISTVTVTGEQTILGAQTYPRYANGKGVKAYLVPVAPMGAGTPTIQIRYTNPASVANRLTPSTPSLPLAGSAFPVGAVLYSGAGAGKFGPWIPLQGGDNGILSIQTINFNASMTSGALAIVYAKEIGLPLPFTTQGVPAERDYINQQPSAPIIPDGACLNWLIYQGSNAPVNSPYYGAIQTVWG
jgi:hypothetical protein